MQQSAIFIKDIYVANIEKTCWKDKTKEEAWSLELKKTSLFLCQQITFGQHGSRNTHLLCKGKYSRPPVLLVWVQPGKQIFWYHKEAEPTPVPTGGQPYFPMQSKWAFPASRCERYSLLKATTSRSHDVTRMATQTLSLSLSEQFLFFFNGFSNIWTYDLAVKQSPLPIRTT